MYVQAWCEGVGSHGCTALNSFLEMLKTLSGQELSSPYRSVGVPQPMEKPCMHSSSVYHWNAHTCVRVLETFSVMLCVCVCIYGYIQRCLAGSCLLSEWSEGGCYAIATGHARILVHVHIHVCTCNYNCKVCTCIMCFWKQKFAVVGDT